MFWKKIGVIVACAACLLFAAGCSQISNTVNHAAGGVVEGTLGTSNRTLWFDFTVQSAEILTEYAGLRPGDNHCFVDVVVQVKATFSETIPMGTFDFLLIDETYENFAIPMDPADDTMMPLEFFMDKGDSVEYHMLFDIPAASEGLVLMYTEVYEDESEGATFLIDLGLDGANIL